MFAGITCYLPVRLSPNVDSATQAAVTQQIKANDQRKKGSLQRNQPKMLANPADNIKSVTNTAAHGVERSQAIVARRS
jgi:hypothetical protein